ncbi:MAG: hypothetical protein GXO75_00990 [Calditrichaeota bacterium]|nr:hypothetical protein [Calditrichota bacterium]
MAVESIFVFVFMSLIAFYIGRKSLSKKIKYLSQKLTDKHLENQALLLKIAEIEAKYEK